MNEVRVSRLHRGRVSRVKLPAGARLLVARGECWLTAAGGRADYVLRPGDEYSASGDQEIVLQAFGKTVVYAVRYLSRADAPASAVADPVSPMRSMSPLPA
jgi:hypothetical protein